MLTRFKRINGVNVPLPGQSTIRKKKLNKTQKQEVKRLIAIRQELKYFLVNATGATTSTLGIASLSDIPQGSTDSDRTGDRLMLSGNMDIRISYNNGTGSTGDIYNTYRFIVLQWHPSSVPAVSDILLVGPSGNRDVYSHYSHDNRQQYRILLDKTVKTVGNNSSTTNPFPDNMTIFHHYIVKMRKALKQIQYAGGSTTGTNKLYYILGSDSLLATHPTYQLSAKLFYRDG